MKYIILTLIIFSSCTSDRLCRKAERKGCYTQKSDTITIRDTFQGWSYDTIVKFDSISITDTLITSNGSDSIITIVKWKERTIQQIKREKDTIVESKVITNTKVLKPELKWYQKYWWVWIVVTFLFCLLLIKTANKITYIR